MVFFMQLLPVPAELGHEVQEFRPFYRVAKGELDTAITILRRILQSSNFIAQFVQAFSSHFRRFDVLELVMVVDFLIKLWLWARSLRQDPLYSEFLNATRTSLPLWRNLFEASSRSTGELGNASFSTRYILS